MNNESYFSDEKSSLSIFWDEDVLYGISRSKIPRV